MTKEPGFVEVFPFNSQGDESCWRWGSPKLNDVRETGVKTIFASQTRGGDWRIFEKYRKESVKAKTIWTETEFISEQGTYVLGDLGLADKFQFPKPPELIRRCIQLATNDGDLILDSFAGSGTTGHAVLKQNAEDGGNRRFILVEMNESIARDVTAERVKRISRGYENGKGEQVEGLGGGFQFCKLSKEPLFTADGQIRDDVTFAQLAEFVWFAETGIGYKPTRKNSPMLGVHEGRAIYLLYNGILGDKSVDGGNVLTSPVLDILPKHDGPRVIYAAACRLGTPRLNREGIVFKQTPYALDVSQ